MSQQAPAPSLEQALACLREGRLEDAARMLAQRLQANPSDGAACHLAGIVLLQRGEAESALRQLERARRLQPGVATVEYNRGNALMALRREAEAVGAFDAALQLQPDFGEAAFNRGNALRRLGRDPEALASYRRAAAARPHLLAAHRAVGVLSVMQGLDDDAVSALERVLAAQPDDAEAHNLLGVARHRRGELAQARACYERALQLQPESPQAWNNLGNALHDQRELGAALECFERAMALQPVFPEAVANRGMVVQDLGRFEAARADYDRALVLRPGYREALQRRAALNLLQGRLREGWADYEQGHAQARDAQAPPGAPRFWQGEDLAGRSLLLSEPNGLGDTLQFFRFVPRLLERGARLAFTGPRSTFRLLAHYADRVRFIERIEGERFDYQCWLWSLPHYLGIESPGELSAGVPWLGAEPERVRRWSREIDPGRFNIGVCWQGNPRRKIDSGRSIPLAAFAPLAALEGVNLVSLQKGHGLEQLDRLPAGMQVQRLQDFDEGPDAFLDSAALAECLDLVVCADTAITHVAGAMGRPAWLALNPVPDWRWMLDREDSPWYPSVRLFRQAHGTGWGPVFESMADALAPLLRQWRRERGA